MTLQGFDDFDPLTDEISLSLITENDRQLYMDIFYSSNPPADPKNPGCVSITLYDSDLFEIDGGELDFKSDIGTLQDLIPDCIEFMNLSVKSVTKMDQLIEDMELP